MTEFAEIAARAVGAFYVLAAVLVMRMMVMDHLMDRMLSAITLKPAAARESGRRWLMGASALGFGMGGAALVLLNELAAPLFVLAALAQAVYLVWARTAFVPQDDEERNGRRKTINAAIFLFGATVLACWLFRAGWLSPWRDPLALLVPLVGIGLLVPVAHHFLWAHRTGWSGPPEDSEPLEPDPPLPPLRRVRLEPSWGFHSLVDADTGEPRRADDYVPAPLADRIRRWEQVFETDYEDLTLHAIFEDAADEQAHRAEGVAIVAALAEVFGEGNAEGPVYPSRISHLNKTGDQPD